MICPKCGSNLPDGTAFCGFCGASLVEQPPVNAPIDDTPFSVPEAPVYTAPEAPVYAAPEAPVYAAPEAPVFAAPEAPVYTEPEAPVYTAPEAPVYTEPEAPVYTVPEFAAPTFAPEAPVKEKKKGGIGKKILIIGIALAILAGAVWAACTFIFKPSRNFSSPKEQYVAAEEKTIDSSVNLLSTIYSSLSDDFEKANNTDGSFKIRVGEPLEDIINDLSGTQMDLDWVNDLSVDFSTRMDDDLLSYVLGLNSTDTRILTFDALLNINDSEIFLAAKEINDTYLKVELPDEISAGLFLNYKIMGELPDSELVSKLLSKYLKIAVKNIDSVSSEATTLTIDGVSENVTAIKCEITQETALKIFKAVLEEAKNDEDLKKLVDELEDLVNEISPTRVDNLYDSLTDGIDMALESLESETPSSDETLTIINYANAANEIVGRTFIFDGNEIFRYATATSGDAFKFEFLVADEVSVTGGGTKASDGKITAEYTLNAKDKEVFTINVSDFIFNSTTDARGTIELIPSDAILKEADLDSAAMLNPSIEFVFDITDKGESVSLNLYFDGEFVVGIDATETYANAEKLSEPKSYVLADDENSLLEWLKNADFDKVVNNLKKTSFPSEFTAIIEGAVAQLDAMLNPAPVAPESDAPTTPLTPGIPSAPDSAFSNTPELTYPTAPNSTFAPQFS